jgi:hypothetical protein
LILLKGKKGHGNVLCVAVLDIWQGLVLKKKQNRKIGNRIFEGESYSGL